jgi:hypothetical protein
MKIDLTKEELTLINLMRKAPPYSLIKVEKRPTAENKDGDYSRITIESSTLLKNLIVVETEL